jgi:hypothetical protein
VTPNLAPGFCRKWSHARIIQVHINWMMLKRICHALHPSFNVLRFCIVL